MERQSGSYANKENVMSGISVADHHRKRIKHSSSLFSLRSVIRTKRSTVFNPITISQPILDESSREKLRNKVKQSPSMMSLNGPSRTPELVYDSEQRLVSELLQFTSTGALEYDLAHICIDNDGMHFEHYDLNKTNPQELIQRLEIQRNLSQVKLPDGSCFVPCDSVHLERVHEGYLCVLATKASYLEGERLNQLDASNSQECMQVLLKITQLLAAAESKFYFEHRNLHTGNVLLHRLPHNNQISHITIVNCELGRLGPSLYTPLDHPGFYEARVPVLSEMRKVVLNPSNFYSTTNVMWLSHVARYLCNLHPCSELKALVEILNPPRWKMRRKPRSAQEAASFLIKTKHSKSGII